MQFERVSLDKQSPRDNEYIESTMIYMYYIDRLHILT